MLSRPRELVSQGLTSIPEILIGPAQRADLQSLPDLLPCACTLGGFECRLDSSVQVDFGVGLENPGSFSGMGFPWDCAQSLDDKYSAFIDEWVSHDSLMNEHVSAIWFGFDRNGTQHADQPFLYFAPPAVSATSERNTKLLLAVITRGLRVVAPSAHSASLPVIRACLDALPTRGELLLAASLHQRGVDAVRLELRMQTAELAGFLQRAGWPGDYAWLKTTLATFEAQQWHMPIQIEMTDRLLAGISLEFPVLPEEFDNSEWEFVLAQFVQSGYCLPEKQQAIIAWANGRTEALDRQLDLKISHKPDGSTLAKAYLVVEDTLSLF